MGLKELEARRKEANQEIVTAQDKKAQLDQMISKADRLERTTGSSGAVPSTPKADLLDASDIQADHPDKHLRFVNVNDPQKVEIRKSQGYERLPSADGGKQVGANLALFAQPEETHKQRRADITAENARRLEAHKGEVEQAAEGIARELRDRHGIDISAERLMDTRER